MMKVWILTSEHNDYDQHGEYFLACFSQKPTEDELINAFSMNNYYAGDIDLEHVLTGGGRKNKEDYWYYLREHSI